MQFHMVRTSLDAHLAINTTGLSVHYYKGPMSQEEYARTTVELSALPPLEGVNAIMDFVYLFCGALLQDTVSFRLYVNHETHQYGHYGLQVLLEKLRDADAIILDLVFPCGNIVADVLNIQTRVSFSPIGAAGTL
jgi:hypothetical protein